VEEAPPLAVVIVTYNSAREIAATLSALDRERRDGDEVVIVDNASTDGTADVVRAAASWATVVETGANLGFAGGCNLGAARTTAPVLLFLNPDASPEPGCLAALRTTGVRTGWGAWQPLVTMPGGEEINTSGGVIHFLGFGWAGQCGEPIGDGVSADRVAFPSGAALCVRRDAWDALGGFDESYFMYGEDLDLGLRLWLTGWQVGIDPSARVQHHYNFAKGPQKWFLLERNRWRTVLATYPAPLLALLGPALVAFEIAVLPVAASDGWLGPKLRAQAAVIRELPNILRRRRRTQATRTIEAGEFAALLTASLDTQYIAVPRWATTLASVQRLYWRGVRSLLGARRRPR
jgi:N-acetylglucosaminyl-diphospho-decaprenol L-rhamnosyltransferase